MVEAVETKLMKHITLQLGNYKRATGIIKGGNIDKGTSEATFLFTCELEVGRVQIQKPASQPSQSFARAIHKVYFKQQGPLRLDSMTLSKAAKKSPLMAVVVTR